VYKIRSKKLTILLTLIFVLSIMLPLAGPASATTTNIALSTPSVTLANNQNLGTIRITDNLATMRAGAAGVGTEIMLTLPSGVEYVAAPAAIANYVNVPATVGAVANRLVAADVVFVSGTTRTLVVRVGAFSNDGAALPAGTTSRAAIIEFRFDVAANSRVNVTSGTGDVKVNIFESTGAVTSGDVVNARIVTAGTTATALAAPSRSEGVNRAIGTVRIIENSVGALAVGANSISLSLPDGYTWNTTPAPALAGGFVPGNITTSAIDTDAQGRSRVRLNVVASSTGLPGIIDLVGYTIDIGPAAALGDVNLSLGGTNTGITAATLTVAKNVAFGVSVSAKTTPDIFAGRWDASPGDLVITESAAGSLVAGRSIRVELPVGAAWRAIPVVNVTRGNIVIGAGAIVAGTNNRTVAYTVTTASTSTSTIEFRQGTVDIDADTAAGDISATVAGTAGASGTVTLAKIVAPLAASAEKKNVTIGLGSQAAGDITITEAGKGVLLANPRTVAGNLELWCPPGVTFAVTPKVEVTKGNLAIDTANVRRMANDTRLIIPIRTSGTEASTIKISGVKLTLDRTVPEGDVTLRVGGAAVDMVNVPAAGAAAVAATTIAPATTVTPAPVETKKTAAFVIGATTYTVGGVEAKMDVAPYTKDGRTYLPVRFAGLALGVAEENIFWDNATATATLMKGDRVVQFTVGQKAMVINGGRVAIDVAPEVANGRVMLPFRWIATAFGASVAWDTATQTVTMEL
jgi:hypothetical protein